MNAECRMTTKLRVPIQHSSVSISSLHLPVPLTGPERVECFGVGPPAEGEHMAARAVAQSVGAVMPADALAAANAAVGGDQNFDRVVVDDATEDVAAVGGFGAALQVGAVP